MVALLRSPRDIRAPRCDLQTHFAFWRGSSSSTSPHVTPRRARRPVSPAYADQPDVESGLASDSTTDCRLRQPSTNTPHTCTIDANVTLTGVVPRHVAVVMAPRNDRRGTAFRQGTTWCTGVDSMTRSGGVDEGDFQTGGRGGLDARLDAVCGEHRRECSNGGCSAGARRRRHWALRGPLKRERTACRRSMPQVDHCDAAWATGWPLQSSSGQWVWLAAGEGSADPTGIDSGRNGFGPCNCPKPSLLGAVYASSATSGRPIGNEIPGNFDQGDVPGDVQGDIRPDHGRDRGQVVLALQRWDSMSTRPISEADSNRLVLTVAEAADRLGISSDLAYDLVARGELPSLRLGRRIVIPRIALLAFVESATGSGQTHRGLRAVGH